MSETTTQSDVDESVIDAASYNSAELDVRFCEQHSACSKDGTALSSPLLVQDLKQAVTVLKHLRKENQKLAKNFDNVIFMLYTS